MAEPLRLIQAGAGGMGRAWLRTIAANPDVRLVGLVDLDPAVAEAAAADHGFAGIEVAGSVPDLLERVGADALINVTVPEAHLSVSEQALERGLAVLCEKPLAPSVAECRTMIDSAAAAGRLLMVSQSRRYFRTLHAFERQLIKLGPPELLTCEFFKAPHFGGFRDAMAEPLLVDMAIHQFDLARKLIGAEPVSVRCRSFNPSWSWYAGNAAAEATFEFAGGAVFTFVGSWCSPGLETSWNGSWRASTAAGTARWDGDHAPVAELADGTAIPSEVGTEPEQIAGSLAEFVQALRTGAAPQSEARTNINSVAMVEAAVRSSQTGTTVALADLTPSDRGR
ncbi:Gfo/Idh/MocA family protein [Microlunatus parietis]|uniref:Putative dehydrogenase n=1 Tax=Microlunatus parietis TaxID=682979 RepID=A0A7Y9I8J4_9ACTN|nr:Gfo/Idh/MocA family oxidoreductase [Microlunatus parietis]NYE72288.1 putative dehydrogenase [Microlunatus parietis]